MESIENLRELIRDNSLPFGAARKFYEAVYRIECEIEETIERDYMKLPVDADGVPIHVGDKLECNANGYEGTFTVFAVGDKSVIGNHEIEWVKNNPSNWFHIASYCRHVKPRTLEDVLRELVECAEMPGEKLDDGDIEAFADEIRKMFGGDAS